MTTSNQELAVIDVTSELVVRRPPEEVLAEAQKAAQALMGVVSAKPRKVILNGEQYLEFEDWQTVARFYGVTPKVESVEFVKYGAIEGFKARAVAVRADGLLISAAEAECLTDEPKWRSRAVYDREIQMQDGTWVKEPIDERAHPKSSWKWNESPRRPESRRIKVADEPVPLFQLKSMAQTRACSKVLRNVLAWVVVLAGYRPTPAEELDAVAEDVGHKPEHGGKAAPAGQAPVQASTSAPGGGGAPDAGTAAPGAQPTAQTAAGVTTVKTVKRKTGTTNDRPWTRYSVVFADGREGVTFDTTVGDTLDAAAKHGTPVNPVIEKTPKGFDIKGLEKVVAPEPVHVDEPVTGPEKVLTVRKLETEHGPRWVIQTDKRQLVSDQEQHATDATAARTNKVGITPTFEVVKVTANGTAVNKLTSFTVEKAEAREPGQEG